MFKLFKSKAGEGILSVLMYVIILVAAAIPITQGIIATANLTGTTATIVGLIPVFLALSGMAIVGRQIGQ